MGLWEQGVLARMPAVVDHAVLDAGGDGGTGWLLMRDVSGELLPPDRRLTRAESRRLVVAAAALHRVFAGDRIVGLCTLADRISLTAPRLLARERGAPDYLPKILVVGWEVFFDTVPADVGDAVVAMLDDPEPAAAALTGFARTLVQGDLRGANLGLAADRVVVLDWGIASDAPPELDFRLVPLRQRLAHRGHARAADRGLPRARGRPARSARTGGVVDRAALLARRPARARARRGERRETGAGAGGSRVVGGARAGDARAAVNDAFKELEVTGWREPGRGRARAELDWWVQRARESLEVL